MRNVLTTLIALTLVTILGPTSRLLADSAPEEPAAAALSAGEQQLIDQVVADYAGVGLDLAAGGAAPTVGFFDTPAPCGGNLGLYLPDEQPQVRVCWTHEDPVVERALQRQALTHELAHAWTRHNLTDERRAAYVRFNELESWRAASTDWAGRGMEHAAELITWAVLDPAAGFIEFEGQCTHWAAAFTLLTAAPAPAALMSSCDR